MFKLLKSTPLDERLTLLQRASDCLVTIDSKSSTRAQVVNACNDLLKCGAGLKAYDKQNPLVFGKCKAWLENGQVFINKVN